MKTRIYGICLGLLAASLLIADDLVGVEKLLCAAADVTVCTLDEDCDAGTLETWNMPTFVEIDLDNELISTTAASGESRTTAIERLTRLDGQIFLQGIQGGVAFSIVITELTGDLSLAIATEGETATGFGACTPD